MLDANSELCLTVTDDGIGLTESTQASGYAAGLGLRIMRYRAQRVGGSFRIDRGSPRGTAIQVSCPLSLALSRTPETARTARRR